MTIDAHPDRETLAAFGLGRLAGPERAAVEAHVVGCPACCRDLERVNPDSLVGLARAALATPFLGVFDTPPDAVTCLHDHPRYRVLARLGSGGMGTVYKAEHRLMGRVVALKVMAPHLVASPEALDRFRREVRLAARLAHPNIVTVHDADEAGGLHFLVMEYIDGISLDRLAARKRPVPVGTACQLIRQAALGLQHAFEQGMVHRDIKPQNLMVTRKGQVKVLDFGLARMARAPDGGPPGESRTLTTPGIVLGTPDFVAPEQARDPAAADTRSDLYSLGCTLYFLFTGRPPFAGDTAIAKLIAHAEDAPPPLAGARADVPAGLDDVLARLMAKNPANRYATPAEAAAALLPFTRTAPEPVGVPDEVPGEARPEPAPRDRPGPRRLGRRAWLTAAGGLLLGSVAGIIASATRRRGTDRAATPPGDNPGTGPSPVPVPAPVQPRVLVVLAPVDFSAVDYAPVGRILGQGGCRVAVASTERGTAIPEPAGGPGVPVERAIDEVRAADWDAIVLCGGRGVSVFLNHNKPHGPVMTRLLREFTTAGKIVAGIGMSPGVLADAGVLDGRRATGVLFLRQKPVRGVTWEDAPVVIDGPLVTARDEQAAEALARAVVAALRK